MTKVVVVVVTKVVVVVAGPRHLRLAFARGRWWWYGEGEGGGGEGGGAGSPPARVCARVVEMAVVGTVVVVEVVEPCHLRLAVARGRWWWWWSMNKHVVSCLHTRRRCGQR